MKKGLNKAILDTETRWSSSYLMLTRLLELRGFCEDMAAANSDLTLSVQRWEKATELVLILEPFNKTTLAL